MPLTRPLLDSSDSFPFLDKGSRVPGDLLLDLLNAEEEASLGGFADEFGSNFFPVSFAESYLSDKLNQNFLVSLSFDPP